MFRVVVADLHPLNQKPVNNYFNIYIWHLHRAFCCPGTHLHTQGPGVNQRRWGARVVVDGWWVMGGGERSDEVW